MPAKAKPLRTAARHECLLCPNAVYGKDAMCHGCTRAYSAKIARTAWMSGESYARDMVTWASKRLRRKANPQRSSPSDRFQTGR